MGRDMCFNCKALPARIIDEAKGTSPSFGELHEGLRTQFSIRFGAER